MNIIVAGKLPEEAKFKGTCSNCGCVVEADRTEHNGDFEISRKGRPIIQVDCPTTNCGHKIKCRKIKQ